MVVNANIISHILYQKICNGLKKKKILTSLKKVWAVGLYETSKQDIELLFTLSYLIFHSILLTASLNKRKREEDKREREEKKKGVRIILLK